MTLFAGQSREQLRSLYVDAWRKSRERAPLTPLEALICGVIELHPEYQALLQDADRAQSFDPAPGDAAQNPFLHMGLHLAIQEQISIDRPAGIRPLSLELRAKWGPHEAQHALMQALGEILWDAQKSGRAPDENEYLAKARRLLKVK